jgi:hypothetical protein
MRMLVLLGLALGVTQAFASADGDALKKSGLAGRWAENCNAPPAEGNWYDRYDVTSDGHVTETLYNKPDDTSRVSALYNVHILSPTRVAYSMHDGDGEVLDLVIQMEGKRHRTWSSRGNGGKFYINNGKLMPEGDEGTWFNKCSD